MKNKIIENVPYNGYQDNEIVQWLCKSLQPELDNIGTGFEEYPINVIQGDRLDDQAGLLGLTSIGFWDTHWVKSLKMAVLTTIPHLLPYYGTKSCLVQALTLLIPGFLGLWTGGELFLADISEVPEILGSPVPFKYYIQLSSDISRTDEAWGLSVKIAKVFTPLIVETLVTYGSFYADISFTGDPVFQ